MIRSLAFEDQSLMLEFLISRPGKSGFLHLLIRIPFPSQKSENQSPFELTRPFVGYENPSLRVGMMTTDADERATLISPRTSSIAPSSFSSSRKPETDS